jgi:hypothetical protein
MSNNNNIIVHLSIPQLISECFTQTPFNSISLDRIPGFPADRKPEPAML